MKMFPVQKSIIFSSLFSMLMLFLFDISLNAACCFKKQKIKHLELPKSQPEIKALGTPQSQSRSEVSLVSGEIVFPSKLVQMLHKKLTKLLKNNPDHFARFVDTCLLRHKRLSSIVKPSLQGEVDLYSSLAISTASEGNLVRLIKADTYEISYGFKQLIVSFVEIKKSRGLGKNVYRIRSVDEFMSKILENGVTVLEIV